MNRREFVRNTAYSVGASLIANELAYSQNQGKRVGIIGLDTSHATAFTQVLNAKEPNPDFLGYRVVAAYPQGSLDIESSTKRIPSYTEEVKKWGVEIVNSIAELLQKVDVVLLETNDGRRHLEQATEVMKAGKRLFIDKPIAGSLKDVLAIFKASDRYKVPTFSASSLRYIKGIENLDKTKVVGATTFSPAVLEKTHPDLFWYGIHGVETLFTVMGIGCQQVTRVTTLDTDTVVGVWKDGRTGTFRGTRTGKHDYGGTVFTQQGNINLGPYGGYEPLLKEIVKYFDTGIVPVSPAETIEIFAFMEAADESKRQNGATISLQNVLDKAKK